MLGKYVYEVTKGHDNRDWTKAVRLGEAKNPGPANHWNIQTINVTSRGPHDEWIKTQENEVICIQETRLSKEATLAKCRNVRT